MQWQLIHIKGIVQGVGFRPFVYRIACELHLAGWVLNASDGVHILAGASAETLKLFCQRLVSERPPVSVISSLTSKEVAAPFMPDTFDLQTGVSDLLPGAADPQSSASDPQPDASDLRPGTADLQPDASDFQPGAAHLQPDVSDLQPRAPFRILPSVQGSKDRTLVSPDLATCANCVRELFDPADRRYHYPFINCTNCGPRFTIINGLPYDRATTSMATFAQCQPCQEEYEDPANRRFHAQPNACFSCGPHLTLRMVATGERFSGYTRAQSDALIACAVAVLDKGGILALKGLGGYHLACSAASEQAVALLRKRKQRPRRPLAIMVATVEAARALVPVSAEEAALLESPAAPIVLLRAMPGLAPSIYDEASAPLTYGEAAVPSVCGEVAATLQCNEVAALAPSVCCGVGELGLMLPSTPLHHLLCVAAKQPLVMTSGNVSEEPIIGDDKLAWQSLSPLVDAFLTHDRAIVSRYDDSVVRVLSDAPDAPQAASSAPPAATPPAAAVTSPAPLAATPPAAAATSPAPLAVSASKATASKATRAAATSPSQGTQAAQSAQAAQATQFIRRARGYAPLPLTLPFTLNKSHTLLACGAQQKAVFALATGSEAYLSQHLGDLDNVASFNHYLAALATYQQLFALEPTFLVTDAHPGYATTRWAEAQAQARGLPLLKVQHHHAHIASVLAEHLAAGFQAEPDTPVIGLALDGTGYGGDGTIWGGEVLLASLAHCERFASLEPFCLPGGEQAIYHPERAAFALLAQQGLLTHPGARGLLERLGDETCTLLRRMLEQGVNTPLTSSSGRLFDAVSALLGVCAQASYEGEPAVLLEAALGAWWQGSMSAEPALLPVMALTPPTPVVPVSLASPTPAALILPTPAVTPNTANIANTPNTPNTAFARHLPVKGLVQGVLDRLEAGASTAALARYFHEGLMQVFRAGAQAAREQTGIETVALSGGVWANRFLAERMAPLLAADGFQVLTHRSLPPGDGAIAYGQVAVAGALLANSPKLLH